MSKAFYLILLCLSAHLLKAAGTKQEGSDEQSKKLFVGVNFAPAVAFRTLRLTDFSDIERFVLATDNYLDRPMFGFDVGANIDYQFNKFIGIETGIQYSQKGFQSRWHEVTFASGAIDKVQTADRFHYIDLPVKAKFYAGRHKVKFVGGAGLIFDFLIGTTTSGTLLTTSGTTVSQNSYTILPAPKLFNVASISGTLSAGIDYRINRLMGIRVEPFFSHEFIQLNHDGSIYHYLWSAGINVAWYFGVK